MKKQSKWKKNRNKNLYSQKKGIKNYIIVVILLIIVLVGVFMNYNGDFGFKPVSQQNIKELKSILKEMPISPIDFNKIESKN